MKTTRQWRGAVVTAGLAAAVVGLVTGPRAPALEYIWNTTTGNWTESAKWTPNGTPGATDTAWLGKTGTTAQVVTLLANQDVMGLRFTPDNAGSLCAVTVDGAGMTLNLGSAGLNDAGSRGGTSRTINPDIVLTAAQDWQSGDNRCPMYVNGDVSGAFTLTRKGNGNIFIARPNPDFSGNVIGQNSGAFVLNGDGATLGTGAFTFAGSGVGASAKATGGGNVGVYALTNDVTVTANSTLRTEGLVRYTGSFAGGAAFNLTVDRVRDYPNYGLFSFDPGAGESYTPGTGTTTLSNAGYAVKDVGGGVLTLNSENLNIGGGILVLDNLSWADLMANRSGGYNTAGANTWQFSGGGGFAARGTPVEITAGNGIGTSTFDRNFTLGITTRDADGTLFANQPVTVNVATVLTAVRTVSVPCTGAGATDNPYTVAHVLKGTWSGPGALAMAPANTVGLGTGTGDSTLPELVLAGANAWTGGISASLGTSRYLNSGPGGLLQQGLGFVRFDGQGSLPSGNDGSLAYVGTICGGGSDGVGLRRGILFTGGDGAGKTYTLNPGYKLLIGADRNNGGDTSATSFGSTGGLAVLHGMDVYMHSYPGASSTTGAVVQNGELVLGTDSQAVRFIATQGVDTAAVATATAVVDGTSISRLIRKIGPGTLVLDNFTCNKLDGSDNKTGNNWNLAFTVGKGNNSVFDGAIRETGNGASNSTLFSNSPLTLVGGVLELDGVDCTRGLDNHTGGIDAAWSGGMGFAAHGGNRIVNLFGNATPSRLDWGGSNRLFVAAASDTPLIFGSTTADSTVDFRNPFNLNVGTGSLDRYIRLVRGVGTVPEAEMTGGLVNTGAGTANLIVSGYTGLGAPAAGTLVLSNSGNNTYNGTTTVQNGATLLVNGILSSNPAMVTVAATATLGGTGTILRPITVNAGGTLAPGASPGSSRSATAAMSSSRAGRTSPSRSAAARRASMTSSTSAAAPCLTATSC